MCVEPGGHRRRSGVVGAVAHPRMDDGRQRLRSHHRSGEWRAVLRVAAMGGIPAIAAAWAAVSFSAPLPVVYACYFAMGMSVGQ